MTKDQEIQSKTKLKDIRETWSDLPAYVHTYAYEVALLYWIKKHVSAGRTDIETLIIYALHHEAEGREPYFEFNRSVKDVKIS